MILKCVVWILGDVIVIFLLISVLINVDLFILGLFIMVINFDFDVIRCGFYLN